jgi:hypothetical protein
MRQEEATCPIRFAYLFATLLPLLSTVRFDPLRLRTPFSEKEIISRKENLAFKTGALNRSTTPPHHRTGKQFLIEHIHAINKVRLLEWRWWLTVGGWQSVVSNVFGMC